MYTCVCGQVCAWASACVCAHTYACTCKQHVCVVREYAYMAVWVWGSENNLLGLVVSFHHLHSNTGYFRVQYNWGCLKFFLQGLWGNTYCHNHTKMLSGPYFTCIGVLHTCMSMHAWHLTEEHVGSPGTGVTNDCELLCGCWEPNFVPKNKVVWKSS